MATLKSKDNLRNLARNLLLEEINVLIENNENKLDSEKNLAKKFNISRVTIRSALSDLEREGKITRQHGRGTFISPNFKDIKVDLFRMKTYGEIIKDLGYNLKVKSIATKIIKTPNSFKNISLYNEDRLIISTRIYYADDNISALCLDFLPIKYEDKLEEIKVYDNSIFDYFYKVLKIEVSNSSIEFQAADYDEVSNIWGIDEIYLPKKSILIKSKEYDNDGNLIFISKEYVNTDYIPITTIRHRTMKG